MISSTAQINTFTAGMDTDTDVNLLPNNKYRYAQDVRIVTDDQGTTGVLQSVDGAKKYNYGIKITEEVIGTATINDIALVVTKLTDGYNRLYRIENFNSPNLTSTVVLQGKLGLCQDSDANQLSIVLNFETNTNIKAYLTDGTSAIKVINIMSDKYVYKPGEDNPLLDSDGNIINTNSIEIVPNAILPPFEITEIVSGNFNAGKVQYCYRLYNKQSQQTAISSMSNCVHLDSSDISASLINHYGSQKGDATGKGCTMEAELKTKDYDRCSIIRIFYEDNNAVPTYSIIDDIEINTDSGKISYTDAGNNLLSTMTQEEFNSLTNYNFVCTSLASIQNRLFAANITEESWTPKIYQDGNLVEYDARAYRANSGGTVRLETSNSDDFMSFQIDDYHTMKSVPKSHDCINPYNVARRNTELNTYKYVYGLNNKLGGNGINISYSFINTELKETFCEITNNETANDVGISVSSESVSSLPIYELGGSKITDRAIQNATRQRNYADPIISSLFRSYQRDEIYRFGIVFYNSKFIPSPVLWIADIRFPQLHDARAVEYDMYSDHFLSKPIGVQFNIKNMPVDAVSYEIVRCDRTEQDRTVLTQGVITPVWNYRIVETSDNGAIGVGTSNQDTNEYRPLPYLDTVCSNKKFSFAKTMLNKVINRDDTSTIEADKNAPDYWRFISPEVCFNGDKLNEKFKTGVYLRQEEIVTSKFDTGSDVITNLEDDLSNWVGVSSRYKLPTGEEDVIYTRKCTFVDKQGGIIRFNMDSSGSCNAYIQKFYIYLTSSCTGTQTDIVNSSLAPTIPYNVVENGGVAPYKVNIGSVTYTNWATCEFNNAGTNIKTFGPAGPCLILQSSSSSASNKLTCVTYDSDRDLMEDYCALKIVNAKVNTVPYSGNTYSARTNSTYIPVGAYGDADTSTVYAFGGDTYIGILDYPSQMIFQKNDANAQNDGKRYFGAYIPLESSINLKLTSGSMTHRTYNQALNSIDAYMQLDPIQMGSYHTQDKPFYLYNDVYSSVPDAKLLTTKSLYSDDYVNSPNRIFVSQAKTPNENIDSWASFKTADFLDVDAQYGEITNIRGIANRLYFWQGNAFGTISVNERSLIQDNNIGQLVLGTGGILDRFDYISTINGTSITNDRSITSSDTSIYWYDGNKNEICKYSNGGINIITKACNLQSYMSNMYEQKTKGANSLYDRKYNEVWFRLYDKSLIYNERLNAFTSLYTFGPDFTLTFRDKVVAINNNDFYVINSLNIDGFGNTTKDSRLKIVVNKDPQYTKVFDNIALQGNFVAPDNKILTSDILESAIFTTKHQTSTRKGEDLVFDYREDTYRLPVPRQDDFDAEGNMSFPARMKGKYMVCDYKFKSSNDYTFEVPQITTTYRYSRI